MGGSGVFFGSRVIMSLQFCRLTSVMYKKSEPVLMRRATASV